MVKVKLKSQQRVPSPEGCRNSAATASVKLKAVVPRREACKGEKTVAYLIRRHAPWWGVASEHAAEIPGPQEARYLSRRSTRQDLSACRVCGLAKLTDTRGQRERIPFMAQQKGTIKFFNTTKGYGFITPEGGSKDVFVHITALERSGIREVREGTTVFFDVEDDRRGRGQQATNIKLA